MTKKIDYTSETKPWPDKPGTEVTLPLGTRPFLRTAYNYDMNAAGDEDGLSCKDPTLTKQSFAEEVDINTIVRRFNVSGELPQGIRMPQYGDFTATMDYKDAMNAIRAAQESFDAMPADIRARFKNDPQQFVEFCSDKENLPQARKWGLVPPEEITATPLPNKADAPSSETVNGPAGPSNPPKTPLPPKEAKD